MPGIKSFGATLKVATNIIGGVTDISIGGVDVTMIDITSQDSTGGYKEYVGGLKDGGTVDVKGNFLIADVGQVYLRANPGVTGAVTITLSDGTTVTFDAIIGGFALENPLDGKVGYSIPLRITGPVTYAAA